jgi:hypothetical protein
VNNFVADDDDFNDGDIPRVLRKRIFSLLSLRSFSTARRCKFMSLRSSKTFVVAPRAFSCAADSVLIFFFALLLFIRILIARATSFFHVTYGEKAHFSVFVAVLFSTSLIASHRTNFFFIFPLASHSQLKGSEKVCLLFAYDLFKRIIQLFFFLLLSSSLLLFLIALASFGVLIICFLILISRSFTIVGNNFLYIFAECYFYHIHVWIGFGMGVLIFSIQ